MQSEPNQIENMDDLPPKSKIKINGNKQNQVKMSSIDANSHTKSKVRIDSIESERVNQAYRLTYMLKLYRNHKYTVYMI